MRVVLASQGKTSHYNLARYLYAKDMLEKLFTGYPRWKLRHENLPNDRVSTFPWVITPYMALLKTPLMRGVLQYEISWFLSSTFDRYVASCMPKCDVFIGMSGSSLSAGRAVQQQGGIYVCDRASTHIILQDRLLREEYARHGKSFSGIDQRFIEKELAEYDQADMIKVPSEFVRQSFLKQNFSPKKIIKAPYGVDLQHFMKIGEPSSKYFDVVFVGRVSFRKGIPDLLRAFQNFKHPCKRLTVVGSMSREVRDYLSGYSIPENVIFTGHCPQWRLKEILSRSHVMVLPSIEEGLAKVIVQSLACGCPVIASENTGAQELIVNEVHGFIVPIRNPGAIVNCLDRLNDEPDLRERMSTAALKLTHEKLCGWEAHGDCIITELTRWKEIKDKESKPKKTKNNNI